MFSHPLPCHPAQSRWAYFKKRGLNNRHDPYQCKPWVARFKFEGISNLRNKPGKERKPILDSDDKESLLEAVKAHRQRVQVAKAEWKANRGKSIIDNTLHRFPKVLTEDIKE